MAIPSFYHPDLVPEDTLVQLSNNEALHASKSRRLGAGQPVILLNGKGLVARSEIESVAQREVSVRVLSTEQKEKIEHPLTVATAVPKGDRQRVMVDMLTQLGVKELIPLACEHSVTRYKPNMHQKWRRWAVEACKQSQNPWMLEIDEDISLVNLLKIASERMVFADINGLAMKDLKPHMLKQNTILVIGPEGGFSDAEITLFHEQEVKSLKSSGHILRTETAAVALAAQWLAGC